MRDMKCKAYYKPLKITLGPEQIESINFETKVLGVYMVMDGKGYHKLRMSDFEIMWYTGLQDRYGQLCYDGDHALDEKRLYEIEWCEKSGQYVVKLIKSDAVLAKDLTFPLWKYIDDMTGRLRFEIINNPDLLGG